jgi:hypothetical protein
LSTSEKEGDLNFRQAMCSGSEPVIEGGVLVLAHEDKAWSGII